MLCALGDSLRGQVGRVQDGGGVRSLRTVRVAPGLLFAASVQTRCYEDTREKGGPVLCYGMLSQAVHKEELFFFFELQVSLHKKALYDYLVVCILSCIWLSVFLKPSFIAEVTTEYPEHQKLDT